MGNNKDLRFFDKYPWLCGYLISPVAFFITSQIAPFYIPYFGPLLKFLVPFGEATSWYWQMLQIMWYFHFFRRAFEVAFINRYKGVQVPEPRDSVIEFFYYMTWGALVGLSVNKLGENQVGMPPSMMVYVGVVMFWICQIGNFYCHFVLRNLRTEDQTHYVIPHTFPFQYIIAPHYTFEVFTWVGYALAAGCTFPSLLILFLTVRILWPMAANRRARYIELYSKSADSSAGKHSPANRWVIVPFVY